jgi:hypothetical protein
MDEITKRNKFVASCIMHTKIIIRIEKTRLVKSL